MYLSQQARKKKKTSFEKSSTLHILYATKVIRQVVRECLSVFSIKDAKYFFLTATTSLAVECVEIDEWIGMEN